MPSPPSTPGTCSSGRTAHGRTGRWSASTGPCKPNGPTAKSSSPTPHEPMHWRPGWTSTTINADTPHSADSHRPAGCHQPHDRVHLDLAGRELSLCSPLYIETDEGLHELDQWERI